jgi:hypothetical protein
MEDGLMGIIMYYDYYYGIMMGIMDHGYSACVTITKVDILLSKKGMKKLCMKLYKKRLLLGLQYILMAGQGIMDFRTRDTITKL